MLNLVCSRQSINQSIPSFKFQWVQLFSNGLGTYNHVIQLGQNANACIRLFASRLYEKIKDKERRTSDDLSQCRSRLKDVKHWIEVKEGELQAFEEVSVDPQTLHAQREELKVSWLLRLIFPLVITGLNWCKLVFSGLHQSGT